MPSYQNENAHVIRWGNVLVEMVKFILLVLMNVDNLVFEILKVISSLKNIGLIECGMNTYFIKL